LAWTFGSAVATQKMPATEGDLCDLLSGLLVAESDAVAFVEDIPTFVPMPGNVHVAKQVSSAAKLFDNFGFIKGFLMSRGVRLITVRPQTWQKPLGVGTKSGKTTTIWKNQLKNEAQKRFPKAKVTLGTADALLILDWGLRNG
jgi:hypothetical protein